MLEHEFMDCRTTQNGHLGSDTVRITNVPCYLFFVCQGICQKCYMTKRVSNLIVKSILINQEFFPCATFCESQFCTHKIQSNVHNVMMFAEAKSFIILIIFFVLTLTLFLILITA